MEELKSLNTVLEKKSKGKIQCQKLYPVVSVQIGKLSEELIETEEECSIHVEGGRILLK